LFFAEARKPTASRIFDFPQPFSPIKTLTLLTGNSNERIDL
jgi:hypothetical protein